MNTKVISTGIQFPDTTVQTTALPVGTIGIWSGTLLDIPTGWQLCDGTNGTPNMIDRFFVGAGNTYAVGDIGGTKDVVLTAPQLPSHSHTISVTLTNAGAHTHTVDPSPGGNHSHSTSNPAATKVLRSGTPALENYTPGSTGPSSSAAATVGNAGSTHTHTVTVTAAGSHTHTITMSLANTGISDAHDNMPPYYALAFIMKMV